MIVGVCCVVKYVLMHVYCALHFTTCARCIVNSRSTGNAGMEVATGLQNTAGFVALMSDFQFSWRSHYVGDVRSVNAQFIDGYLLKSL